MKKITVHIFAVREKKSVRDRHSGILRFFNTHNNVTVVRHKCNTLSKREMTRLLAREHLGSCGLIFCSSNTLPFVPGRHPAIAFIPDTKPLPNHVKTVSCDNTAVAKAAVDLLIKRGHTDYAYVGSLEELEYSRQRGKAFEEALKAAGYTCSTCTYHPRKQRELLRFVQAQPKPCGILAYNDDVAQDLLDACNEAHISVPDQVNIIGVDNDENICESLKPTLTSIKIDFEQSGYKAAELLLQMLKHPELTHVNPHYGILRVVERESTQDINGNRRLVTNASIWLAQHYAEHVTVSDLARAMHTCRRRIEIKFRSILGRTIHDELQRLRLEAACELLSTTERSISEIADSCGYTPDTFRLAFIRKFKHSPLSWRRKKHAAAKEPCASSQVSPG